MYYPHLYSDKQFQLFYGGSSSGKSFFIAQATILNVLKGHNYLITRKYKSSIKKSIFNEIIKAISFFQLSKYFLINSTDMTITCITNDCQILFSGLDDPEKVKSITPKNGVITRILIEEATEIEEADFKQLTKRLRGSSRLKKSIILTFNPVLKTHWVFREFFDGWDDSKNYMENDKISILKTTYKDNRFLTQKEIYLKMKPTYIGTTFIRWETGVY